MKKHFLLIATLFLTISLAACSSQNNDTDRPDKETVNNGVENNISTEDQDHNTNTNENDATLQDDMKKKVNSLDYTDFELEIDYDNDKEYQAEIKQHNGRIEANLEDELNGVDIFGEEAFNIIYPIVQKLTIERGTSNEAAIDQVLNEFNLDKNYRKIEIEITFKDGKKVEFKDMR